MKAKFFTSLAVFAALLSSVSFSYSGGLGTDIAPYEINTPADWQQLMNTSVDWNLRFILTADINLAGITLTPIGNESTGFTGALDGNNHIIRNAVINTPNIDYVGLFSYINGQIRNLGVENVNITGGVRVGALCGFNLGTIISCYIKGAVTGTRDVGGLCGANYYGGTITSCYAAAFVFGESSVGGLCGTNGFIGLINKSYTNCTVSGGGSVGGLCGNNAGGTITSCYSTGLVSGNYYVGGLCGINYGGFGYSEINRSYATGTVTSNGDFVGGLCGGNIGDYGLSVINHSHAIGDVSGNNYVGGLCGGNDYDITSCYAAGKITGTGNYVGGLCGLNTGLFFKVCFWNIETSGTADGVGNMNPDPAGVMGKTTVQMQTQSTFTSAGWDFVGESANGTADLWRMCIDGISYPKLNWQYSFEGDFDCPDGVGIEDLLYLAGHWLQTTVNPFDSADVTGDRRVDISDFTALSENWP